jgi:hypothetical protein
MPQGKLHLKKQHAGICRVFRFLHFSTNNAILSLREAFSPIIDNIRQSF